MGWRLRVRVFEVGLPLSLSSGVDESLAAKVIRPAVKRGYAASRAAGGEAEPAAGDMTQLGFRRLLLYVRRRLEICVLLDAPDGGMDKSVSQAEFEAALGPLAEWGVAAAPDAAAAFTALDSAGSGGSDA